MGLHNFLEARDAAHDADLEVPHQQPGSSPIAGAGRDILLSAGYARRVEIVKALGLPCVAVEAKA